MSVWFNVRLTVIGFWCLPLITSENWGGQFILWMHTTRHQKLRSWRPRNIIKAFYNAALCVIGYVLCVCVCVCERERMAGALKCISIFSILCLTDAASHSTETFLMPPFLFRLPHLQLGSLTHRTPQTVCIWVMEVWPRLLMLSVVVFFLVDFCQVLNLT